MTVTLTLTDADANELRYILDLSRSVCYVRGPCKTCEMAARVGPMLPAFMSGVDNKHPCERGHDVCPCWDGQGCCIALSPTVAGVRQNRTEALALLRQAVACSKASHKSESHCFAWEKCSPESERLFEEALATLEAAEKGRVR